MRTKVDEALRRSKADLKTIGEIRGGGAITRYRDVIKEVYYQALRPLERIDLTEIEK